MWTNEIKQTTGDFLPAIIPQKSKEKIKANLCKVRWLRIRMVLVFVLIQQ